MAPRRPGRLALALITMLLAWAATISSASAAVNCDLYASPSGSDHNPGTQASPLATVQALDENLSPGQTGCLQAGSYGSIRTQHNLDNAGTATGQITITSAPGQTAHIIGLVTVQAPYTTLSGLDIDGSNDLYTSQRAGTNCPYPVSNGLEIDGRGDIFENNNLYQSVPSLRGNGIGIGWNTAADNAIIRDNRIHDLGQCKAFDQMIYLAHGNGVQIYNNWMWNDAHGWGVQIYPSAANAHVHDNVIDSAGSGIVIGGSTAVANNTVEHNIIINSTGLPDAGLSQGVGISTCCGIGPNNSFTDNTVYNNRGGIANATGVTLAGNTTANPNLADPSSHDYRTLALPTYSLWNGNLGNLTTATDSTATSDNTTPTTPAAGASPSTEASPEPFSASPVASPATVPAVAAPPASASVTNAGGTTNRSPSTAGSQTLTTHVATTAANRHRRWARPAARRPAAIARSASVRRAHHPTHRARSRQRSH